MSEFADQLMLKYTDPTQVRALLVPAGDTAHQRVRRLLETVYELRSLTLEQVAKVEVLQTRFQVPVAPPLAISGSWEMLLPRVERTQAALTATGLGAARWIGMELDTLVSVKVSTTDGALERVASADLSRVATLDEFKARFAFIDLPAFMAAARVRDIDELRAKLPQLFDLEFAEPPAFDPDDPAATRTFRLTVCVLFAAELDLEASLREVKAARHVTELARPHVEEVDDTEVRTPCAWLLAFPAAVQPPEPTLAAVQALFQREGIVAVFES